MSSQLFDAQLLVPDSNASHKHLFDLIEAGKFTGRGLPDVAHKYLDAFCNKSYSKGRRRWVGIALVGMMRASASVVQRLQKLSRLARVGAIVLDREETEERRVIAGLIMRQGLEAGLEFGAFWESRKVSDSAPNFPKDASELWTSSFQTYLDNLSELKLTDLNTEAVVMYPISLSTKDGFQWAGRSSLAIVEDNVLTTMISDLSLTKFRFIDIPLSHVTGANLVQDSPHESQEGHSGHKMHTLIVSLRRSSSNYRFNTRDRTTSNFKVSFQHRDDAREFQAGLEAACRKNDTIATIGVETLKDPDHSHEDSVVRHPISNPVQSLDDQSLAEQGKGRGKLPSISEATKQKAVRSQRLPSGSSNKTKPRAAKAAAPILDESEAEDESGDSSEDEYYLKSAAQVQSSVSSGNSGKPRSRRKTSAADEDFVPNGQKQKSRSTKRKRASSDAAEQSSPKKRRSQTKTNSAPGTFAASKKSKKQRASEEGSAQQGAARAREPMVQSSGQQNIQNGVSARHSLIGGLVNPKSPSTAAAPTFKRPGQPASTPGRPRSKPARATPKTPHDTHRDQDDLPICISSSTPRSQSIHDEDFGVGYHPVDKEILSSNTKRVPDSPHAESTAISGHADQEDIRREKRKGDLETARNDPFQQRREGQKITTLLRKLTAEGLMEGKAGPEHSRPVTANSRNEDLEINELAAISASRPRPKHSPSLFKHGTQFRDSKGGEIPATQIGDTDGLPTPATNPHKPVTTAMSTSASRSLMFEAAHSVQSSRHNPIRTQRQTAHAERSCRALSPASNPKDERDTEKLPEGRVQANDSVVSGPQEAIEDTLLEAPEQAYLNDLDADTTLIGEEAELPAQHITKEPDLRFGSSPPVPDSSSVREASPDVSEPEPELSPPTSRVDELEWEQALQPHQRDLHEQLLRTSKRIMRHIVDNETAVTDIADSFADDGERLLSLMLERQDKESTEAFRDLVSKKQSLLEELSAASKDLRQQRRQLRADDC